MKTLNDIINNHFEKPVPCNLSFNQIKNVVRNFSKETKFSFKRTDIRDLLKTIGGEFYDPYNCLKIFNHWHAFGDFFVTEKKYFIVLYKYFSFGVKYDIACGLGHYVLHSFLGEKKIIINSDVLDSDILEKIKNEASIFALELLIPSDYLKRLVKKGYDFYQISDYFFKKCKESSDLRLLRSYINFLDIKVKGL